MNDKLVADLTSQKMSTAEVRKKKLVCKKDWRLINQTACVFPTQQGKLSFSHLWHWTLYSTK